jgi:hypothetical protein
MDKGDCFLMGNPNGQTKHLWVVISDTKKHGGEGVIVNFTKNKDRAGGECFLSKGDHPWFTETHSWACFIDAMLMTVAGWNQIKIGIGAGFIVAAATMPAPCLQKIIAAAKSSALLPSVLKPYLD